MNAVRAKRVPVFPMIKLYTRCSVYGDSVRLVTANAWWKWKLSISREKLKNVIEKCYFHEFQMRVYENLMGDRCLS